MHAVIYTALFCIFATVLKQRLLIFFVLLSLSGYAQSIDTLNASVPDSLYQKPLRELDSVQQFTKKEFSKLKSEYDSIDNKFKNPLAKLRHQADSASSLGNTTDDYKKKIDSVTHLRDGQLAGVKGKTEALKEKSAAKINSLKLSPEVSKEAQRYTQDLGKLDVSLPDVKENFPAMPSLAKMPNTSLPGVNIPNAPNILTPGINSTLPDTKMDEIKSPQVGGELKEINEKAGVIGKAGEEIKGVKDQVSDPEARKEVLGKVEEKATEKAAEVAPVKDVTEKVGMPDNPLKDGELSQSELKEQVKQQAVDHFAGKEQQVQAAMSQVSKLKQQYSSVQSMKDLPKRPPNPMKEKAFVERLVPALGFQILFRNEWLTDFYPSIGYRFNGRITAGFGWNQRWGFTKERGFNSNARIYGPRIYTEVVVFRGIAARVDLETMYTRTPPILKRNSKYEDNSREWVPGIFGGIKKSYTIVKNLKGTVAVLYNLYNPDYKSPYGDRLMTRFGFEYSIKKKIKRKTAL